MGSHTWQPAVARTDLYEMTNGADAKYAHPRLCGEKKNPTLPT